MSVLVKLKYFKPSFWRNMAVEGKVVWRTLKDRRTPIYLKLLPLLGVLYVVFPDPFIAIPFDDITVMMVLSATFLKLVPQDVVNEHRAALGMPAKA